MFRKEGSPTSPPEGQRWYCFNDSRVCPINDKEIERQFSGKESAYMLFYRKSCLQRPPEGKQEDWLGQLEIQLNLKLK